MKKLVATRPIQYMGRTYESGTTVPAYEGKMVGAWLAAGSVKWSDTEAAEREAAVAAPTTADVQAADALRAMGAAITDDTGAFVGAENLAEQIRNLVNTAENAQENAQDGQNAQEGQEPTDGEKPAQEGQEPAAGEKPAQEGSQAAAEPEMVTGHLETAQLERMTKTDLADLAEKMGVDISTAKNNAERAALIAAVTVQAPANENGGAQ